MKSRTLIFLFCALALVHLAAQFVVLQIWLDAYGQDDVSYDLMKTLHYGHLLDVIAFPGSLAINALPLPQLLVAGRVAVFALFAVNSVLWSGVISATLYFLFRLFRPRLSPVA